MGIQKGLPEGFVVVFLLLFFYIDEAREEKIQIFLKAAHYWPADKTPFKLCFAGVPMMAQGIMKPSTKKLYTF